MLGFQEFTTTSPIARTFTRISPMRGFIFYYGHFCSIFDITNTSSI